jgi:hypothetical protein
LCLIDPPQGRRISSGLFAPSGATTWSCNFDNVPSTNGQLADLTAELHASDGTLLASSGIQITVS